MTEPRQRLTLLQLAIAASTAVVPVLLAVLLIVASARQVDGTKTALNSDRHVSVRQVAALKTFEYAIIQRNRVTAGPPSGEALLARFPQCRSAWDGRGGVLTRMRRLLTRSPDQSSSVAIRMALQLDEIDQALLAFSTGDNRRVSDAVGIDSARWFDAVTHRAANTDRDSRLPRRLSSRFNARTSRAPYRRSRARMGECSPRWPGAAPKLNA